MKKAPQTLTHKIMSFHQAPAEDHEGYALRPAQVLLQDATGTLVMQALEAMEIDRIQVPVAVQYVDHNLMQADFRNPDDHLYLKSAAGTFGLIYSEPGEGVSHPVHAERFGRPGLFLLGSDSHTCGAGALGMLGIGAGSFDVAAALAGEPFHLPATRVIRVVLTGTPPPMTGAKDVILTLLGRYGTAGARGAIVEYDGPGVECFGVMERMVIANMGAEMGATSSVFPSDHRTRAFLEHAGRAADWQPLSADGAAIYDETITLDLNTLEPMIAQPSSPANVVPVRDVAGTPVGQVYVGSSASPGFADIATVAQILDGRPKAPEVSLDLNPATRTVLLGLMNSGLLPELVAAGGRLHQIGCNGCNGMGQSPGSGINSLRTVPRNFPGRSGSRGDRVWLCGPETAAAAALTGVITDPRDVAARVSPVPEFAPPHRLPPLRRPDARTIRRGPNIAKLPSFDALPVEFDLPVLLRLGDDVSTDAISPAGAEALPYRSNPEKLAEFVFARDHPDYAAKARATEGGHAILGGRNFGQGSSREHATLCPRLLGLRVVAAVSFARIFHANLINVGILPLWLDAAVPDDARLRLSVSDALEGARVDVTLGEAAVTAALHLTPRDRSVLRAGGLLPFLSGARGAHLRPSA